jgi:Leucine-rich repeat (LRR) protein
MHLKAMCAGIALLTLPCLGATTQLNGVRYQIPANQYSALVDLYNQTSGGNWKTNSGWLNADVGSWFGVEISDVEYDNKGNVTSPGNVTAIRLNQNGLAGTLPNTLSNFTELQGLALGENQLTGGIPSVLGNLYQLQELYLHGNQLSGTIPGSLGNLSQLQELYLHNNQLTGTIPDSLGNLVQLVDLYLQNNQLSGAIPSTLGSLTQLQSLALHGNQLGGSIPGGLGSLTHLQELSLANNQLTGSIPAAIGNLLYLQNLYFHGNQLTGTIPSSLGQLGQLVELYLGNNRLSGSIPTTFGNLKALQILYLQGNLLSGTIPDNLGGLTQLQELSLGDNQLAGSIPSTLGNLIQLQALYLHGNQLTGPIPGSLTNLVQLKGLYLRGNQLTGSIPSGIGKLVSLTELYVDNNQLAGQLPAGLGNLTQLQVLSLGMNQCTGSIPSTLGGLVNLQALIADNNQFTGGIPTGFSNLLSLQYLYLQNNQLSGSIPPGLGKLTHLTELDCSANHLSGTIPSTLANLVQLNYIGLSANSLSGDIPRFLGLQTVDPWDGAYLDGNSLEICPGTVSRSNVDWMLGSGKQVVYDPQTPKLLSQPQAQLFVSGATAMFTVVAGCSTEVPYFYQWQAHGTNLLDDARISGSQAPVLTIDAVQVSDAGNYTVVVSNFAGGVTSSPMPLTVLRATPAITWQTPLPIINGTRLDDGQLNATTDVPGTFAYSPSPGTLLSTGTNALMVVFTPADTANYTTAQSAVNLIVLPNTTYYGIDVANPAQAGGDPDKDGLSSLMEYALGTNPTLGSDPSEGILASFAQSNGQRYASLAFRRRKSSSGMQLQYIPEVSGDLKTWYSDLAHVLPLASIPEDDEFDWVTVRDQAPATSANPRFIRLRVTLSLN